GGEPRRPRGRRGGGGLAGGGGGGAPLAVGAAAAGAPGIRDLFAAILPAAAAEPPPLMANPKAPARAFVLEANLDPGRGPVATVLVDRGILHVSDPVVAGGGWGKVRALFDENGKQVSDAGPSMPVEVLGLDDVPLAGDELRVAPDEQTACAVGAARASRARDAGL